MTDNLATITDIAIDRVIGKLPMKTIDKALNDARFVKPKRSR
jgi:hypothetical protein